MKKKYTKLIIIVMALIAVLFKDTVVDTFAFSGDEMRIHIIDVGQGDSTFIELPNGEVMLIDAAEASEGEKIYEYITDLGYASIDYVIGTHPHTDHIGGLAYIIENLEVENIYMPKALATSKTYENLLTTIADQNKTITTAKQGVEILDTEELDLFFIAPVQDEYSNLNNYSAVLKINYGNKAFLFMGDAEALVEKEITDDVAADFIRVGHHGSASSSSQNFVNQVSADYAVISVGKNNQYDLPKEEVINRWEKSGAKVYRTDLNGNIIVTSNGSNIKVEVEK